MEYAAAHAINDGDRYPNAMENHDDDDDEHVESKWNLHENCNFCNSSAFAMSGCNLCNSIDYITTITLSPSICADDQHSIRGSAYIQIIYSVIVGAFIIKKRD